MAIRPLLKRILRILPLASVAGLLLIALFLVASVEQEDSQLGSMSLAIFLLTALALLVLLAAIAQRLVRLVRQARAHAPGARLRARLVAIFIALALPPVIVVYLFSVEFVNNTIEGWFNTGAEPALADSIEMAQLFLDLRTRQSRDQLSRIAAGLPDTSDEDALLDYLFSRVSSSGPVELALLTPSGRVDTLVHINPQLMVANLPTAFALSQAVRGQEYSAAEPGQDGLRIRVLMPLDAPSGAGPGLILQGIFPLPENFSSLAAGIEQAYFRFENTSFLRQRLQQSFILILSLVLGITALLAILLAFNAAGRLVRPIRDLAAATELMRDGQFPETLNVTSRDELGFLVESFNNMASELQQTQQQLEAQRQYLETLLSRLSAGVIAFDSQARLAASNQSASDILGIDLAARRGQQLEQLREEFPEFSPLFEAIGRRIDEDSDSWRQEIKLERADHALALVCRGSSLPDRPDSKQRGHVVVFDDVTMLDQAQRQAAWAELAQRLAHEVKNPLTPIRLAAERLQLRLADQLEPAQAELLRKSTNTIINQADALRGLVDAFGDYTRPGKIRNEALDITTLITSNVELWTAGASGVSFELQLDHGQARPSGDAGRFGQVLNNLVQNAREAHPSGSPHLRLQSSVIHEADRDWLQLRITDDGPGFSAEILPRVFEPYVSTKPRGTGLGLAIVRRLMEEMGGRIQAGNAVEGGACLTLQLPLRTPWNQANALSSRADL
ncbi:MAG: ATP-binding protein [Wenzhouxiangellaceae bacterium]|nr:ATP-binding protein [Wenzhouxiangellaceae bacterium]